MILKIIRIGDYTTLIPVGVSTRVALCAEVVGTTVVASVFVSLSDPRIGL